MTRLPTPGQDNDAWGDLLNSYLSVAHNTDGSIKLAALPLDTDTTLTANSDSKLATQKAVKAYVDGGITAGTTAQYFRGDRTWQTLNSAAVGLSNVTNTAQVDLTTNQVIGGTKIFTGFQDKGGHVYNVKAYGATGGGVADDTAAIQATFDAAEASATGGTVFFPAGTYLSGQIIWKSSTNILGSGIGRTIIKAKPALNNDLIISENFNADHNTNYNGYSTMSRNFIRDLTLIGDRSNQTIQSVQGDPVSYHFLIKFYGWLPVFENIELDDCEAALYTEYSNNQPHDPFENYELFEGRFAGIRGKNYARAGWCFRGPHDSHISDIKLSGGDYDTPDFHFLADNNGNYGGQGTYVNDMHTWGTTSATGADCIVRVGLNGFLYTEGSTNVCTLIETSSCNLTILVGFQDTDNNGANDAAVIVRSTASATTDNNNLKIVAYYGPVYGDLIRVEKGANPVNGNSISAQVTDGVNVTGALFNLVGTLLSNAFTIVSGQSIGAAAYNTDTYTGGNNRFEGRIYGQTIFSTPGSVGKSDWVEVQSDNWPDNLRVSQLKFPVGDKSFQAISTGSAAYIDLDGMQIRNVTDPTSAQYAATKNYVDTTTLRLVSPPATATSSGTAGQVAYDATHIYVCIVTNTWVRSTLASW